MKSDPDLEAAEALDQITRHLAEGRAQEALAGITVQLETGAVPPLLFFAKALAEFQLGQRSEAISSLKQLLDRDPSHAEGKEMLNQLTSLVT